MVQNSVLPLVRCLVLCTGAMLGFHGAQPAAASQGVSSAAGLIHSRIVTRDRGQVRVERLQLAVRQSGAHLRAVVSVTARNELGRPVSRDLRVGPCTRGVPQYPFCPTTRVIRIRLNARQRRSITTSVTLRKPPTHPGAIEAAVVAQGHSPPFAFNSDAELLLTAPAWQGPAAGRTYGVRFAPGNAARRLNFDIPITRPDRARISAVWQGTAAPASATTTFSRCRRTDCTDAVLPPNPHRSRPGRFAVRPNLARDGADWVALRAAFPSGTRLFEAALPWPA